MSTQLDNECIGSSSLKGDLQSCNELLDLFRTLIDLFFWYLKIVSNLFTGLVSLTHLM